MVVWLEKALVLAIHDRQVAEHGGSARVRDEGLLESALARPMNLAAYEEPSLFELAAAYAFGIARNHPFVDGNKRTGLVAALAFIKINRRAAARVVQALTACRSESWQCPRRP